MKASGQIIVVNPQNPQDSKVVNSEETKNAGNNVISGIPIQASPASPVVVVVPNAQQPPKEEEKKSEDDAKQKIEDLTKAAAAPLVDIKSAFPFDPFPDELIVDVNKVTIIHRDFFGTKHVYSVQIKDITDVVSSHDPLFAAVRVYDSHNPDNPIIVKYLNKDEAVEARTIIEGLMVSNEKELDLPKLPPEELKTKLIELGKAFKGIHY